MISIITCSIDPKKFQAISHEFARAFARWPNPDTYEIVGIHDAQGLCEGYNRGLAQSKGDIVIFCHDDIELWADDFMPKIKQYLQTYAAIGVAGTNRLISPAWIQAGPPHVFGQVAHAQANGVFSVMIYGTPRIVVGNIQAMDGLFLAFRRDVIEQIRWDADTFRGFHCYDIDATYRADRAGHRLAVALDLFVCHYSGGDFGQNFQAEAQKFLQKHAATLPPMPPRQNILGGIHVGNKTDALQVMQGICNELNNRD